MPLFRTVVLCLFLASCAEAETLTKHFDYLMFNMIGGTLISSPEQISMKKIRFDNGSLIGAEIIIEGVVLEVSPHGTYLVMSDETARMLVVLTDLDSLVPKLKQHMSHVVRVLGTIETGKKGLPLVRAQAVSVLRHPAKDS